MVHITEKGYLYIVLVLVALLVLSVVGLVVNNVIDDNHAKNNTIILCKGIIGNTTNTGNQDAEMLRLCADVGVYP